MEPIKFFALINKDTNEEVYSSPNYVLADGETTNYAKVFERFKFYFDRVNSGIKQQLESPRTTEEQKKSLKYLTPDNYQIAYMELITEGWHRKKQFWIKELSDYSDIKNYVYC